MNLTIYTITYNRPELLNNLYQTIKKIIPYKGLSFEWLVIYNGIDHDIEKIHQSIISENRIDYRYFIFDSNQGLTRGVNKAHELIEGDLGLFMGDDDLIKDDLLFKIDKIIYILEKREDIAGAVFDAESKDGIIIGNSLRYYPSETTNFELYNILKLNGDKTRVLKKEILKNYRYPLSENELFVPDAAFYYLLDEKHRYLQYH